MPHNHPDYITCLEVARSLSDYTHHELSPEEEKRISEHLRLCEECVRHYRFEESLLALVRERAQSLTAPPRLRARLHKVLESL